MRREVSILISSAGRRVALMDCFRADAAALGLKLRVLAIDTQPNLSAACMRADLAYEVPRCTHPEFVTRVKEIVAREGIDLIVPTIDTELSVYARAAADLRSLGAEVSVSGEKAVHIARNKLLTSETLAAAGVCVPRTASLSRVLSGHIDWNWPLILKPVGGSSSIGIRKLISESELESFDSNGQDYLAQEFWAGDEYTVNMFFDRFGQLQSAVPHRRIEVRTGEVSKGRTERLSSLEFAARRIAEVLPEPRGAICFQAIVRPNGEYAVFEINARFGGGYPLAHAAGATFSKWLLEEISGRSSSASNAWREGVTMLRYDAGVFIG